MTEEEKYQRQYDKAKELITIYIDVPHKRRALLEEYQDDIGFFSVLKDLDEADKKLNKIFSAKAQTLKFGGGKLPTLP
jgi:hypothetical protein